MKMNHSFGTIIIYYNTKLQTVDCDKLNRMNSYLSAISKIIEKRNRR